jgi:hypothetical protein
LIDGPSLGLQLTEADLAEDVDLVAIHQEFYGVPWQAFVDDSPPPAEWSTRMQALAEHAHAVSEGVFLSINMLNGARETLAERTIVEDGQPKGEDGWAARCYDFASAPDGSQMRAAYVRYVEHMVDTFAPSHLNFAVEVNLFFEIPLELVTWWSNRDLLPAGLMTNCPCDYDPTWCQVVDVFRNAAGGPLVPGADYFGEILLKASARWGSATTQASPSPGSRSSGTRRAPCPALAELRLSTRP